MKEQELAIQNMILKIRTGSMMYGTYTPESDEDLNGIFIPSKEYVLGTKRVEQVELSQKRNKTIRNKVGDIDYVVYSLIKFIELAQANNPNIIEFFYAPQHCILECNEFGQRLIEAKDLFLSKKAYHTFKGYSYAQRKKLEVKKENMTGRTELAEKFGYDTKFASHLIRLLLECQQILIEHTITLPLPQNNLVRDIKLGQYSLDWILNKANELEKLVDQAYNMSTLQYTANYEAINNFQIELIENYWSR
jgi:predicted nucleotidyltransferase